MLVDGHARPRRSRLSITGTSGGSPHCATQPPNLQFDVVDDSLPVFGSGAQVVLADPSGRILSSIHLPDSDDPETSPSETNSCFDSSASTQFSSLMPQSNQGFGVPYSPRGWTCDEDNDFMVHPGWTDGWAEMPIWGLSVGVFTAVRSTGPCTR